MSKAQSTKPYADFPLTAHRGAGQWCKKVKGRQFYFGKLDDWEAALAKWNAEKDYLLAGMDPPSKADGIDVGELCNRYLMWQKSRVASGELAESTFYDYKRTCRLVIEELGRNRVVNSLTPLDFGSLRQSQSERVGVNTLHVFIIRARAIFKWGADNELTDPPRFGRMFDHPRQKTIVAHRKANNATTFTQAELRQVIDTASPILKAMVLLSLNAALLPVDIANVEFRHVVDEWIRDFPRVKTNEDRKAWLWPETIEALDEYLADQTESRDKLFSKNGESFGTSRGNGYDPSQLLRRHLRVIGLYRPKLSFKVLRDTFATEADQTGDTRAVSVVMGHVQAGMTGRYIKRFDDSRVKAVCQHVRAWLFGGADDE